MRIIKSTTVTLALSFVVFFSSLVQSAPANKALQWQLSTQQGAPIALSDFKGQPVILHFWATWCPFCKKLQPKLVELQQKYANENVQLVAISFNEDEGATPQDVLAERGYSFITAVNGEAVAEQYDVIGTPTTFFINKKGEVIFKSTSSDTKDPRLELALAEIIK